MKLLIMVICLFSERFVMHWGSAHRFRLFAHYERFLTKKLAKMPLVSSPWFLLVLALTPWIFGFGLAYYLFSNQLYGFVGFLLSLIVLYCCIGPENPFYPALGTSKAQDSPEEIAHYMTQINGQLMAIIFWYVVLGPLAILTYRLVDQSQKQPLIKPVANKVLAILDWLPMRLTMLLYLLVGNFQAGFPIFMKSMLLKPEENNPLLKQLSLAALRSGKKEAVTLLNAERLVEQAIVVLLVILACFTLGVWV